MPWQYTAGLVIGFCAGHHVAYRASQPAQWAMVPHPADCASVEQMVVLLLCDMQPHTYRQLAHPAWDALSTTDTHIRLKNCAHSLYSAAIFFISYSLFQVGFCSCSTQQTTVVTPARAVQILLSGTLSDISVTAGCKAVFPPGNCSKQQQQQQPVKDLLILYEDLTMACKQPSAPYSVRLVTCVLPSRSPAMCHSFTWAGP